MLFTHTKYNSIFIDDEHDSYGDHFCYSLIEKSIDSNSILIFWFPKSFPFEVSI